LQDYVLIDPESKRVEIYSRQACNAWQLTDFTAKPSLFIPALKTELVLAVIFENVS
jgi:Uma2 family endonuclease